MKLYLPLLILLIAGCKTNVVADKSFDIVSYKKSAPTADEKQYRAGDVQVFRVIDKDTVYVTRFYSKVGELRPYEAVICQSADYTRANVDWKNDSAITFTLFNPTTKKKQSFELSGSGADTYLQEVK